MEKVPALLILLACLVMLVRMLLPAPKRQRLDLWARRGWLGLRLQAAALARRLRFRDHQRQTRQASDEAQALIERAQRRGKPRSDVTWDGNVARPRSFRDDGDPPTLH